MRILKEDLDFKDLISRVLTVDYVGALVAAILFPIFLVPRLGLVRTSLVFGMLNAAVGLWGTWVLRPLIEGNIPALRGRAAIVIALLSLGVIKADRLTSMAEDGLFADDIIYARSSLTNDSSSPAARRFSVVSEWQSAIQLNRRISLSRGFGPSGSDACRVARRSWFWAEATAWRCARF